jgi:hypothetical protein
VALAPAQGRHSKDSVEGMRSQAEVVVPDACCAIHSRSERGRMSVHEVEHHFLVALHALDGGPASRHRLPVRPDRVLVFVVDEDDEGFVLAIKTAGRHRGSSCVARWLGPVWASCLA